MSIGEQLIHAAIAKRQAAGLSLRAYGAERYTQEQPYTCHAKDAEQRDRWAHQLERRGFTVEAI